MPRLRRGRAVRVLYRHHEKSPQTEWSASLLVDIPSRWEPRAKQSRTVALLTALCAAALFESCTVLLRRGLVDDATKKPLTKVRGSCFGGELGTRTPDPLRVMHDGLSIFRALIRQIDEICYRSAANGSFSTCISNLFFYILTGQTFNSYTLPSLKKSQMFCVV